MKYDFEFQPLSDLVGDNNEFVVYDRNGVELRTLRGVVIRGDQTAREAVDAHINAGERVRIRRNAQESELSHRVRRLNGPDAFGV